MEQVTLGNSDIEAVVVPAYGARLHSLRVLGTELLRSPSDVEAHATDPFFWGAYVMAPWCNRITPVPVRVGGRTVDLAANFEDGTAIHGEVYGSKWLRTGAGEFAVERAAGRWPWRYRVTVAYAVDALAVTAFLRLTNLDEDPMPGGIGIHPWFNGRPHLRIDSDLVYPSNKSAGAAPVPVSGDLDLRHARQMAQGVDATWPDPADPPVEIQWPELGLRATMTAPSPTLHIVAAYAPERGAIAAEPQTHAPEGLRRLANREPGALTMINPGDSLELPISIAFAK